MYLDRAVDHDGQTVDFMLYDPLTDPAQSQGLIFYHEDWVTDRQILNRALIVCRGNTGILTVSDVSAYGAKNVTADT